ncbi:hypothetical protein EMCRGX_G001559 [Ephydatia muelleri]
MALAKLQNKVGVADLDICGPSMIKMLAVEGMNVVESSYGWTPLRSPHHDIKVMSVDALLPNMDTPVVWRGPRKTGTTTTCTADTAPPPATTGTTTTCTADTVPPPATTGTTTTCTADTAPPIATTGTTTTCTADTAPPPATTGTTTTCTADTAPPPATTGTTTTCTAATASNHRYHYYMYC